MNDYLFATIITVVGWGLCSLSAFIGQLSGNYYNINYDVMFILFLATWALMLLFTKAIK